MGTNIYTNPRMYNELPDDERHSEWYRYMKSMVWFIRSQYYQAHKTLTQAMLKDTTKVLKRIRSLPYGMAGECFKIEEYFIKVAQAIANNNKKDFEINLMIVNNYVEFFIKNWIRKYYTDILGQTVTGILSVQEYCEKHGETQRQVYYKIYNERLHTHSVISYGTKRTYKKYYILEFNEYTGTENMV